MLLCELFLDFKRSIVPSYSGSVSPRRMTKLLDPEEGGTLILQNIANFTPSTTLSHPERLEPSNLKFMNC